MKVRAITLGFPFNHDMESLENLKMYMESIASLREIFSDNTIEVQTVRFCTEPYTLKTNYDDDFYHRIPSILDYIDSLVRKNLVNFYSYLPGLCDQKEKLSKTQLRVMQHLPHHITNHSSLFSSIQVSSLSNGMSFEAISHCAKIIKKLAEKNPFANLQFAATFNVPANTPFFPSAYHEGKSPKISIAIEGADEIVKLTREFSRKTRTLKWLQDEIIIHFTEIYDRIANIVLPFCSKNGIEYCGMDFSPSQYPEENKSIGTAVENIKLSHFGEVGTIFAIGFLTSTLQKINRTKIGFSGFMQPLLEDFMIAKRHDEKKFTLTQMLLNSTVCGLGLDCIPLPGDVTEETLTLLMMDVAMLSTRLNKPLTCRLMPIPGKTDNDRTDFKFEYFTNSKICTLSPSSLSKFLNEFLGRNPGFIL